MLGQTHLLVLDRLLERQMQLETAHPGDIGIYCSDFFVGWFYHEDAGAGN